LTGVRIPISRPWFTPEDIAAVTEPLESGWVVQGPRVQDFERKFAAFAGAPHASAASSCTTALHLAVASLGLKPGDEVIVPAFTWISTANVVEYMGAKPVFCDISLKTFNIDVERMKVAIGPRTVGIIPVHLFGLCADMPEILAVASARKLWVVEDAACGFGARMNGHHAGTFGNAGCFSFHPRKAITTGEGGMTTTADASLDRQIRSLRDHGASRSDLARHHAADGFLLPDYKQLGYNYRMTDIQGALGSAQMSRAAEIVARRQTLARLYSDRLAGLEWLDRPSVPASCEHGYQSYVCLFRPVVPDMRTVEEHHAGRNRIMRRLEAKGIATRQGTHAAALTSFYASKYGVKPADVPNAYLAEKLSLALPLFPQLTEDDVSTVCDALAGAFRA
jgi:dTDP-4-amino-4,6-dideoxygalactose transaminase